MVVQSMLVDCGKTVYEKQFVELAEQMLGYAKENAGRPVADIRKYVVFSTPRVGSTLLCSRLQETGLLGHPTEWFQPKFINAVLMVLNRDQLETEQYVEMILRATATPNDVFGVNIHVEQYMDLLSKNIDLLKIGFHHVYWVQRRDKFKQAYSYAKANKTGFWNKGHELDAGFQHGLEVEIEPTEFCNALSKICTSFNQYERHIKPRVQVDREYCYLDIVADYCHKAVNGILADFRLEPFQLSPKLKMQAQSTDYDKAQILKLKQFFGLTD